MITHYHYDHYCNVPAILSAGIVIDTVLDRGAVSEPTTVTHTNYVNAVKNIRKTIKIGDELNMSSDVQIKCIVVDGQYTKDKKTTSSDENAKSIGLLLKYKGFSFYTAGDVIGNIEDSIANYTGKVNLAKISHHGSTSATSDYFVNIMKPECVIISCGDGNSYGHPHAETVQKLDKSTATKFIYQTNTGSGIYSTKVKVVGTLITSVFDKYYVCNTDTFYYSSPNSVSMTIPPADFKLEQNYPNPFNPSTTIKYSIPEKSYVKMTFYNALGQSIKTLVNKMQEPGSYSITIDLTNQPSGLYFYRIQSDKYTETKKLLLLK